MDTKIRMIEPGTHRARSRADGAAPPGGFSELLRESGGGGDPGGDLGALAGALGLASGASAVIHSARPETGTTPTVAPKPGDDAAPEATGPFMPPRGWLGAGMDGSTSGIAGSLRALGALNLDTEALALDGARVLQMVRGAMGEGSGLFEALTLTRRPVVNLLTLVGDRVTLTGEPGVGSGEGPVGEGAAAAPSEGDVGSAVDLRAPGVETEGGGLDAEGGADPATEGLPAESDLVDLSGSSETTVDLVSRDRGPVEVRRTGDTLATPVLRAAAVDSAQSAVRAPVAAATLRPAHADAVFRQMSDALQLRIGLARQQVDVVLHPAELGRVRVQMEMQGDALRVWVRPQRQAVAASLAESTAALREILLAQGVQSADVEVFVEPDSWADAEQSFSGPDSQEREPDGSEGDTRGEAPRDAEQPGAAADTRRAGVIVVA